MLDIRAFSRWGYDFQSAFDYCPYTYYDELAPFRRVLCENYFDIWYQKMWEKEDAIISSTLDLHNSYVEVGILSGLEISDESLQSEVLMIGFEEELDLDSYNSLIDDLIETESDIDESHAQAFISQSTMRAMGVDEERAKKLAGCTSDLRVAIEFDAHLYAGLIDSLIDTGVQIQGEEYEGHKPFSDDAWLGVFVQVRHYQLGEDAALLSLENTYKTAYITCLKEEAVYDAAYFASEPGAEDFEFHVALATVMEYLLGKRNIAERWGVSACAGINSACDDIVEAMNALKDLTEEYNNLYNYALTGAATGTDIVALYAISDPNPVTKLIAGAVTVAFAVGNAILSANQSPWDLIRDLNEDLSDFRTILKAVFTSGSSNTVNVTESDILEFGAKFKVIVTKMIEHSISDNPFIEDSQPYYIGELLGKIAKYRDFMEWVTGNDPENPPTLIESARIEVGLGTTFILANGLAQGWILHEIIKDDSASSPVSVPWHIEMLINAESLYSSSEGSSPLYCFLREEIIVLQNFRISLKLLSPAMTY